MLAEEQQDIFSRKLCPTQTDGQMKSIVFISEESIGKDDALQNGLQIHVGEDLASGANRPDAPIPVPVPEVDVERTESDLNAVPVTRKTIKEMRKIHELCEEFIGSDPHHHHHKPY
jgi:hypothetical protein